MPGSFGSVQELFSYIQQHGINAFQSEVTVFNIGNGGTILGFGQGDGSVSQNANGQLGFNVFWSSMASGGGRAEDGSNLMGNFTMGLKWMSLEKFRVNWNKWTEYQNRNYDNNIAGLSLGTISFAASVPENLIYARLTKTGIGWYLNEGLTFNKISNGVKILNAEANASRSIVNTMSKFTKPLGILTTGISAVQTYDDLSNGNYEAAAVHGLDTVMGAVGTFGGPVGAAVAGVYFISRFFWGD